MNNKDKGPSLRFVKKELVSDPSDRFEIEIGDSKTLDFKPQFKWMQWDNEVNFSIRAEEKDGAKIEFVKDVVKYITNQGEVRLFEKPEIDDGGFEFEWLLNNKPASNILTATIQHKGLKFYYQPEITDEEAQRFSNLTGIPINIAKREMRPENIVGSYAVYHESKKDNYAALGGKNYKTGKVFHIYRPKAIDANGKEAWCDLNINEELGTLTVTIPQDFLNAAIYPILVDPTFGKTTIGKTLGVSSPGTVRAHKATSGSPGGDVSKITLYTKKFSSNSERGVALYSDSSGANTKLAEDSGNASVTSTTPAWYDVPISYTISASTTYWFGYWGNESPGFAYYYDTGSSGDEQFKSSVIFETWPDPFGGSNSSNKSSIYATYTIVSSSTSTSSTSSSTSTTSTSSSSSSTSTSSTSSSSSTSTSSTSSSSSTSTTSTSSSISTSSTSSSTSTTSTSSSTSSTSSSSSSSSSTSSTSSSTSTFSTSSSSSFSTSSTSSSSSTSSTSSSSSTSSTSTSTSTTSTSSSSSSSTSSTSSSSSSTSSTSISTSSTSSSTSISTSTSTSTSSSTSTTVTIPLELTKVDDVMEARVSIDAGRFKMEENDVIINVRRHE